MSAFGDGSFDQRILDAIEMEMKDAHEAAEQREVMRVMARIMHMWLRDQTGHDY